MTASTKSFLRIKSPTIPSASLPPGNSENKDSLTSNASGLATDNVKRLQSRLE